MDYEREIANIALQIKAIKLRPENPFIWSSGFKMPIYNDNRMFLYYPKYRHLLAEGFKHLLKSRKISYDIIAGTATAGISPATTLADHIQKPLIYIRNKTKKHGLQNKIEGLDNKKNLKDKEVILIEDLISTGQSSKNAIEAIRGVKGNCNYCLSIFNYGFTEAYQNFNKLKPTCQFISLVNYDTLIKLAIEKNYINDEQIKILEEWKTSPFNWRRSNF